MTPDEIHRLSLIAQRAGIAVLEIDADGARLRLNLGTDPAAAGQVATAADRAQVVEKPKFRGVRAPAIGIFRPVHPATGRAPVEPGQSIAKGQIVGFLQVGAALRPVTAPEAGVLGGPLVDDGTVVGYGTQLYPLT